MTTPVNDENAPLVFSRRIASKKPENIRNRDGYCPFCDVDSLENIIRRDGERIWLVNKYRTLEQTMQTIVIESSRHDGDPSNYDRSENREVFRFALSCWSEMLSSGTYKSVLMYKNYGPLSGGSLLHPHFQIVGLRDKDGYERVSPNAFSGVEVVRDGQRLMTLSTHPIMGFVEINASMPATTGEFGCEGGDVDWLADVMAPTIRHLLTEYHGGTCTSYNLFFYYTGMPAAGPEGAPVEAGGLGEAGRIVCKLVPRWSASPYFVGYRISQVDSVETLEAVRDQLRPRILERLSPAWTDGANEA